MLAVRDPRLRRAWRFLQALAREYREAGGHDSAASLTYTTLFAVVPLMTVAFAILKMVPALSGVGLHIETLIFENFVPATGAQVRQYLAGFADQAASLTTVGIVFLLAMALLLLLKIERVINRIWRVHRPRRLVSSLLVYWALLTLGPLLLGTGIAVSSYLLSVEIVSTAVGHLGLFSELLALVPFLAAAVLFSMVYIAVPNCNVPLRDGVIGGIVAALLLELARHAFTFFVTRFSSYELVYGAFAAVPLFLLWIYISWVITLFGVVLAYVLASWDDEELRDATAFPALLKILALFRARQHGGEAVDEREVAHVARLAGIDNWQELRERLLLARLLERSEGGALLLACDLSALRVADILRLLDWKQIDAVTASGLEQDAFAQAAADYLREAMLVLDAQLDEPVGALLDRLPERFPETAS